MSRVQVGERFGRYTVVRHTAPRVDGEGKSRSCAVVRCCCGAESVVYERSLKAGRASGCSSRECYWRNQGADELDPLLDAAKAEVLERYRKGGPDAVREWLGLDDVEVRGG